MKRTKMLATLLAVALIATCFNGFQVSASEKRPVVIQKIPDGLMIAWGEESGSSTVTPSAITIGIEVTPPAISIEPPAPYDLAPEEVLPCPPEPIYDEDIPSDIEITEIVIGEGDEDQIPPTEEVGQQEGIHVEAEEMHLLGYIVLNSCDHGIIDPQSPIEFNGNKRLKFGQFALMIYNAISPSGQVLDTKENRKMAIQWIKDNYNVAYKASKKMTYKVASKVFSKIKGEKGELWREWFKNIKKEGKQFFPSLSLEGDKMSRIEGLYAVVMLLEPDMPCYYPLSCS